METVYCHIPGLCGLDWVRRKTWPESPNGRSPALAIADLFCGCGGLTLGAWEAARQYGWKLDIRLAADLSAGPLAVYRSNFNVDDAIAVETDVAALFPGAIGNAIDDDEKELSHQVGELDLLVAGPPCQGHSDLNNRTRRQDPRNSLYLHATRAIEVLKPRAAIIENVSPVVHDSEGVVQLTESHLELGYSVSSVVADVSRIGLAQRRRRHVLVAVRDGDFNVSELLEAQKHCERDLRSYIGDLEDEPSSREGMFFQPSRMTERNRDRVRVLFEKGIYDLPDNHRPECHRDGSHTYRSVYGRLAWDKAAQTITSGFGSMGQGRYVHPSKHRVITPHEAARIQGFPDFFDFESMSRRTVLHETIGNAVPPKLCAVIVAGLIERGLLG